MKKLLFLLLVVAAVVIGLTVRAVSGGMACAGDTRYMVEVGQDPTPPPVGLLCILVGEVDA